MQIPKNLNPFCLINTVSLRVHISFIVTTDQLLFEHDIQRGLAFKYFLQQRTTEKL